MGVTPGVRGFGPAQRLGLMKRIFLEARDIPGNSSTIKEKSSSAGLTSIGVKGLARRFSRNL